MFIACSALLEHIVRGGVQSIKQQAERAFPSVDLIIECGDRLRRLLVGLRHRGAFSHVYSHFEAVCQLLHQSPEPRLSAMIPQWLESMFDQMQSASISITRRSGGIPYGILALVMCDPSGQLLHTATSRLFDMTADIMAGDLRANTEDKAKKQEDDERIIAQVHAMNTLRMLLTDARLGRHIACYIAHSFQLAIHGMASTSWPIRNCAVMMLSPLVTRVFGAKSLASDAKDTLSGVSVREFFKKYPQLEPFLLARLTEVNFANAANEEQVEMSLYPVLLVLAHLKPSLSDQGVPEHNQTDGLAPMIAAIRQCASSRIYKIREMASYALVALVNSNQILLVGRELADNLQAADKFTTNELHGRLCQLYQLLRHYPRHQPAIDDAAATASVRVAASNARSSMQAAIPRHSEAHQGNALRARLVATPGLDRGAGSAGMDTVARGVVAGHAAAVAARPARCHPVPSAPCGTIDAECIGVVEGVADRRVDSELGASLLENVIAQPDMDPASLDDTVTILRRMDSIAEDRARASWSTLWPRFMAEKRLGRRCSMLPLLSLLLTRMKVPSDAVMLPWIDTLRNGATDEADGFSGS
ncbi:putative death-receptor fusion protein-domain-containing protein [Syncephalis pseudoplumigaleata]|uniref:Putative death-receptor fusion protein-domain-containing protein n=1 Tax=Syncephalis pseudoplumigaleata TaxID=1712513 RepID=A0A4V1J0Z0_9FUNG|nr:putative death-receptor fusion protein-domain-containing protein [Syncephalis pseudoplumigaleata]|eukprot:RKP23229.1 putative death-receptor fusion protein-domain-containing protein [Syncephalis pseudoplumigaleata]